MNYTKYSLPTEVGEGESKCLLNNNIIYHSPPFWSQILMDLLFAFKINS